MSVILDREKPIVKQLEGKSFYDTHLPKALKQAKEYAGEKGFVASMPQLLHGRVTAPADNEIWDNWYTALSEEDVGKTPEGNTVVIEVHGTGILSSPERIERAYKEGLTPQSAAKFSDKEIKDLLNGKLPDGTEIPVFSLEEFKKGIADLPMRYAVIMDFDTIKKTKSDYQNADKLKDNDLVIVRAGGIEQASAYIDKAKEVHETKKYGNWHPFKNIDPEQPQGRVLFLGDYDGLIGGYDLGNDGRFVGVAPEALEAREKILVMPTLEQIMKTLMSKSERFVAEANKADFRKQVEEGLRQHYK